VSFSSAFFIAANDFSEPATFSRWGVARDPHVHNPGRGVAGCSNRRQFGLRLLNPPMI